MIRHWITATAIASTCVGTVGQAQTIAANPAKEWAGRTIPLEQFAQFPQIANPRLSPDGKTIAAKFRIEGGQVLALLPLGSSGKPLIISRDEAEAQDKVGDRQVRDWRWLDSDHLMLTITFRDSFMGDRYDNVRYVVVNRATLKAVRIGYEDSVGPTYALWASHEGTPHVLLQRTSAKGMARGNNPEVIDVNADTGDAKVVVRSNPLVTSWTADSNGVVRIGTSRDRGNGKVRLVYRSAEGEFFRTLVNEVSDRYDEIAGPDLITGGTNGKAYAYSRKDGYRALYEYDLEKMALGTKIYGAPGYDIENAFLNATRDKLAGVVVTTDREHTIYFDPRMKEIQAVLEEDAGAGNVRVASTDLAQEKILFELGRPGQAPGYYLLNTKTGQGGLIAWAYPALGNAELNPVTTVKYPTSDGRQVEAVLTMPRHKAGQKALPLVVMPHGGPWARDSADWDPYNWAQAVAELGYVVIQPNFLGSTGYGREWEKGAEGKWGYRMSDDLNEAVAWLAQRGTVDAKRVCMMGWSYGGYASARAAQRDGKTYRCAIAGAAPVDMAAMVAYDRNYLGRYGAKAALGSASNDLDDISPALHAEEINIPILIVHGAKDERVPVSQARGFVSRLKRAGKVEGRDFEYLEQPKNTHNLLREEDRRGLLEAIKGFLAKYNPA